MVNSELVVASRELLIITYKNLQIRKNKYQTDESYKAKLNVLASRFEVKPVLQLNYHDGCYKILLLI